MKRPFQVGDRVIWEASGKHMEGTVVSVAVKVERDPEPGWRGRGMLWEMDPKELTRGGLAKVTRK